MQRQTARASRTATSALAVLACAAAAAAAPDTGLMTGVEFTDYSPLSASAEITRRLLSPLAAAQVARVLERSGERLVAQSIDLAAEKFLLYVPPHAPPGGYGLLVFIPPWDEAQLPRGWAPVLDRYGVIFVSAARSGNATDTLGRREPLALLAAYNLMHRFAVDAQRVYVGGFSGGARIALRLAFAYPDLFHGALLNAGSDRLDAGPPSAPPRELLLRFQESMRLVYVTGEHDALHLSMDAASLESLQDWCVFDAVADTTPGAGHEPASPVALSRALARIATHAAPDPARLAACRKTLDGRVEAQLARVQSLAAAGRRTEALRLLEEVDRRFGGLAAPRSLALAAALE
jgi:pimeloyl-ACP methyl ester carboxylesterase